MSSSSQAPPRKSNGRRKVRMAKMENQSNLQVTFSKRRAGLFKKASELCVLCGVEAAIIIFSPAEKVYSFGHPNVENVINKFLNETSLRQNNNTAANHELIVESHRNSAIRERNLELVQVERMLTAERNHREELDRITKTAGHMPRQFPPCVDGLDYTQLSVLKEAVLELVKKIEDMVHMGIHTHANSQHSFDFYDSLIQKNENLKSYPVMVGSSIHGAPFFDVKSWSHGLGNVSPYFNPHVGISESIQMAVSNDTNARSRGPNTHDNFQDILNPMAIFSSGPSSAAASTLPYGTSVINSRGSGLGGLDHGWRAT